MLSPLGVLAGRRFNLRPAPRPWTPALRARTQAGWSQPFFRPTSNRPGVRSSEPAPEGQQGATGLRAPRRGGDPERGSSRLRPARPCVPSAGRGGKRPPRRVLPRRPVPGPLPAPRGGHGGGSGSCDPPGGGAGGGRPASRTLRRPTGAPRGRTRLGGDPGAEPEFAGSGAAGRLQRGRGRSWRAGEPGTRS